MTTTEIAITATDARRITEQIKVSVEAVWHLIAQAYTTRAWSVLGYPSWDDYCTREFGTARLRLPREERSEVVASLRESGLSLRAIAAATGDSHTEVRRSLGRGTNVPPEPVADPEPEPAQPITGTDGKTYQRRASTDTGAAEIVEDELATGQKQRRRPLPESFWQAAYDLMKVSQRIERLSEDDRFPKNAGEVAASHRNDLIRVRDVLQDVINRLPQS